MGPTDMEQVGGYILEALRAADRPGKLEIIKLEVAAFTSKFEAPGAA
jgi:glycine/serine hydroxymethyltransferase